MHSAEQGLVELVDIDPLRPRPQQQHGEFAAEVLAEFIQPVEHPAPAASSTQSSAG